MAESSVGNCKQLVLLLLFYHVMFMVKAKKNWYIQNRNVTHLNDLYTKHVKILISYCLVLKMFLLYMYHQKQLILIYQGYISWITKKSIKVFIWCCEKNYNYDATSNNYNSQHSSRCFPLRIFYLFLHRFSYLNTNKSMQMINWTVMFSIKLEKEHKICLIVGIFNKKKGTTMCKCNKISNF